jgi:hypothetical protein
MDRCTCGSAFWRRWRKENHHSGIGKSRHRGLIPILVEAKAFGIRLETDSGRGFCLVRARGDHSLRVVSLSRKTDRAVGPEPDDGDLTTSDAGGSGRPSMSHCVIDAFDQHPPESNLHGGG